MITIDVCLFETGEVIKTLEGEEEEKVLAEANEYFLCNNSLILIDTEYDYRGITVWVK